jgi:hypothetical protein
MTKITRVVEHAHNDSERNRHGPISRASGSTNRGGRGVQGLIWVMELQSLVYNTTTRAHGTGRRRKSWLPFSCFCFYVFCHMHLLLP